jgi:hypothetical protein
VAHRALTAAFLLVLVVALAACGSTRAATWTHPTAHVIDVNSDFPHDRLPWVEVYRMERGGVLNKARVWGWTADEARRDAEIVARALGR